MPKEDTQFKPGNPGGPGRTPGSRSVETLFRDAIEKIAKDNPEVKDVERELIITLLAKAKKGDMKALEMYLDRLYGKPKQTIDGNIKTEAPTNNLFVITPEQEQFFAKMKELGSPKE